MSAHCQQTQRWDFCQVYLCSHKLCANVLFGFQFCVIWIKLSCTPSVFVILSVVYVMLYANAVPSYSQNRFVCLWYQNNCAVSTEKSCIYHKGYIFSTQLCQLFTYYIYLISNILVINFYLGKEPQNTKMYI